MPVMMRKRPRRYLCWAVGVGRGGVWPRAWSRMALAQREVPLERGTARERVEVGSARANAMLPERLRSWGMMNDGVMRLTLERVF